MDAGVRGIDPRRLEILDRRLGTGGENSPKIVVNGLVSQIPSTSSSIPTSVTIQRPSGPVRNHN